MVNWNANIPQPGDLISNSQGQILTNNQTVNTVFNDTNNGNFTKFLVQAMGAITPALVDPISAYHTVAGTGITQNGKPLPYFQNSNGDYPLFPDLQNSGNQYSFTIGDVIVKFGFSGQISPSTVTFAVPFPTDALAAVVTGTSTLYTGGFVVSSLTASTLTVSRTSGSGSTGYYYIVIGN